MTRAEFAKVIVKLLNIQENASASSVYTDLDGAGWAKGFIGAVTPKYMEGPATGKFNPGGQVTTEELATILVRVLGLKVDADAKVEGKVSDWAKANVAAAIKAGVIKNGTDFTQATLRSALVESTYAAVPLVPVTGVASAISEAKQAGASTLSVKFNGKVDTEKAKITVKRDGTDVVVSEVKWSDDKASANVILEKKLLDATYTVSVEGVAEKAITAEAKGVSEVSTKIDFVTASEILPFANKVRVEFKVVNQFGEAMNANSANLKVKVSGIDEEDYTEKLDKSAVDLDLAAEEDNDEKYDTNDRVTISVTDQDSQLNATKVFTIGSDQIVSKVEIGKVMDESGAEIQAVEAGDKVYLQVTAYDQYGIRVMDKETLADDVNVSGSADIDADDGKDTAADSPFNEDVDNDGYQDLRLFVEDDAVDGEQTVTVFAASGSVSKVIKINTTDIPASVAFASSNITMTETDGEVGSDDSTSVLYTRYVPLIVKNADGEELTKEEISKAMMSEKEGGTDKLELDTNGAVKDAEFVTSGAFQGQIKIDGVKEGSGSITVSLSDKPEQKATVNVKVATSRKVEEIRLADNNGDEGINLDFNGDGSFSDAEQAQAEFTFKTFDQYGDEAKEDKYRDSDNKDDQAYRVRLTFTAPAGGNATLTFDDTDDLKAKFYATTDVASATYTTITPSVNGSVYYATLNSLFNKQLNLKAANSSAAVEGTYKVKVELLKENNKTGLFTNVDEVTKNYKVLKSTSKESYTWTAAVASGVKDTTGAYLVPNAVKLSQGDIQAAATSNSQAKKESVRKYGKEIVVTAKDGATTVLVPHNIKDIALSSTAYYDYVIRAGKNRGYVFGLDDKASTVTAQFYTNKGVNTAAVALKGSNNPYSISQFTGGQSIRELAKADLLAGSGTTKAIWNNDLLDEIVAKDATYGNSFSEDEFGTYKGLGIYYTVIDKQNTDDSLVVNADGTYTFVGNHASGSFTIKLTAPSGAEKIVELGYK